MKGLLWLRSDLRMDDNPALRSAFEECDEVAVLYLYSANQLRLHNESNIKIDFIIRNLKIIGKKLSELNSSLIIHNSNGFNHDPELVNSFVIKNNIEKIYINSQFGIDETSRDEETKSLLKINKVEIDYFNDQIIYKPGFLKTGQGNPFSVFTPFKRRWVENFNMESLDIDYVYKLSLIHI